MERTVHSYESKRIDAALAFLIGLVLIQLPLVGLTLAIAGPVLYFTEIYQKGKSQRKLEFQDAQIAEMHGKLAELRVQLAML